MTETLRKNFALLMASNLLSPIFSMALVLAIGRVQGAEALGKYSLVMTVFVLGQNCATLGLPIIITRHVAQSPEQAGRYFLNACAVTLALLVACILVTLPIVRGAVADAQLSWAICLIVLALLPSTVSLYGEAVLLAFERAGDFVVIGLAENIVRASVGCVLALSGFGIQYIALGILATRLAASGAFLIVLRHRGVSLLAGIEPKLCRDFIRQIPVVGSIPIVNAIYARVDILLLTWLGTWTEVGIYSAALRLVDVARTIPPAYSRALYPVLSRLHARSAEGFADVAQRSVRSILLLMVPVAFLLFAFAEPLITLLYGAAMADAAANLRILAWTLIPVTLATTLAQVLFAAGKQAIDLRVNLIGTVVSVAANLVLIPPLGSVGAALAVLISASVYAALQYLFVRQEVIDPAALPYTAKLLGIALASSVLILATSGMNALVSGVLGCGMYAVGIGLAGILTWGDLQGMGASLASMATRRLEAR